MRHVRQENEKSTLLIPKQPQKSSTPFIFMVFYILVYNHTYSDTDIGTAWFTPLHRFSTGFRKRAAILAAFHSFDSEYRLSNKEWRISRGRKTGKIYERYPQFVARGEHVISAQERAQSEAWRDSWRFADSTRWSVVPRRAHAPG